MALRPWDTTKLLLGRAIIKAGFLLLRFLFMCFQALSWKLQGIEGPLQRIKSDPGRCAQVLKVHLCYKYCPVLPPSLRDFILTHNRYVDPEYVIQNDHVSLFFLDPHQDVAVFSEGKPGQMMWKSDFTSFMVFTLYEFSQNLIVMPMSEFRQICAMLPEPQGQVIIMGNTGRCGSTLITQIFECSKKVVSYSEPSPFNNLAVLYAKKRHCQEVHQLTRNLIKMYCRPLKGMPNVEGYLIKPTGPSFVCVEPIKALYPDARVFYLYRDMDKVTKSYYKLSFIVPMTRLSYVCGRISGDLMEWLFSQSGLPTESTNRRVPDDYSLGVFSAILATNVYRQLREKDKNVHGLLFDDLVENKEKGVKAIFKFCGLSQDLVDDALTAFTRDSQRNSIVSQEAFAKIAPLEYTEEDRKRASKMLEEFGFPPLDQPCRLEGSLDFDEICKG